MIGIYLIFWFLYIFLNFREWSARWFSSTSRGKFSSTAILKTMFSDRKSRTIVPRLWRPRSIETILSYYWMGSPILVCPTKIWSFWQQPRQTLIAPWQFNFCTILSSSARHILEDRSASRKSRKSFPSFMKFLMKSWTMDVPNSQILHSWRIISTKEVSTKNFSRICRNWSS